MELVKHVEVTIKGEIRRLNPKPGDRLVLTFRERLPITAIHDVKRQLEHYFPHTEVLVIAGVEVMALIPSDADVLKRVQDP